jgi:hypothetical protein
MSSPMMDLPQLPTTSSSRRKGNCSSATPPPAAHVSFNQAQVGLRYGRVKIISAERRYAAGWRHPYVETRCAGCGSNAWISLHSLARGVSKGCQQCSRPRQIPRWLDRILTDAKRRCTTKTHKDWLNYGGRGIEFRFPSVLEAGLWVLANLGERPSPRLELDRINNNGHYAPGNLRWATRRQGACNTRRCVLGEWDYHVDEWPYAFFTVRRLKLEGLTRAEILERAALAVEEKRKNWRTIAARLAFLTS